MGYIVPKDGKQARTEKQVTEEQVTEKQVSLRWRGSVAETAPQSTWDQTGKGWDQSQECNQTEAKWTNQSWDEKPSSSWDEWDQPEAKWTRQSGWDEKPKQSKEDGWDERPKQSKEKWEAKAMPPQMKLRQRPKPPGTPPPTHVLPKRREP